MTERKILLIVEGEVDEPAFIKRFFEVCHKNQRYAIYSYKTNIHELARNIKKDYPNFDDGDSDLKLILKSYEKNESQRSIFEERYTDIFLIFDFDPQNSFLPFDMIRRMINYYNDSTDQGKFYINYPMMQSYKHFSRLPDDEFYKVEINIDDCSRYKEYIDKISGFKDIRSYRYEIFVSLTVHHLKKLNYILTGEYVIPESDDYEKLSPLDLFDKQVDKTKNAKCIYVINTSIFILIDYNPSNFFAQLKSNKSMFSI